MYNKTTLKRTEDYLELILIKSYKHLSLYEKDWTTILEENQDTNPFMRFEFVYNWWKCSDDNQNIEIYAVKEHKGIIAFFPFQSKKTWFGNKVYFLATDKANYMDIVAKNRDKNRVIMFTLDKLIKNKKSIVFYLNGLLESKGTPSRISDYCNARSLKEQYFRSEIPYRDLDGNSSNELDICSRKTIFSTNTIRARTYRNYLWTKEKITSKSKKEKNKS
jgi:hypothetical protein